MDILAIRDDRRSIIAPVLVEQLLHQLPVVVNALVAGEIAEPNAVREKVHLDPASDEGEIDRNGITGTGAKAEMYFCIPERFQKPENVPNVFRSRNGFGHCPACIGDEAAT